MATAVTSFELVPAGQALVQTPAGPVRVLPIPWRDPHTVEPEELRQRVEQALPFLAAVGLDKIDASSVALLVSFAFLIMQLVWAAPCGWLGDKFGKKRIFALGLGVMGVTALLSAFATTIPQILFYLIFLAFGNTAQTVLFGVYLADLIPGDRVGEFTGLSAFAETGGSFLSIVVAGALINLNLYGLQYRMIFMLTALFLLLAVVAVQFVKARVVASLPIAPAY